jgi:hypothetical protein
VGALLDDIKTRRTRNNRCNIKPLLEDPDIGPDLAEALAAHPRITYADISRALADFGYKTTPNGLSAHNRGECSCFG